MNNDPTELNNYPTELLELSDALTESQCNGDTNLFEMVPLKEFRHSAILGYLLNRKEFGKQVHLKSFLGRVLPLAQFSTDNAQVLCEHTVNCPGGKRPIDVLCLFGSSALIIENKCKNAKDQEHQIADYVDGVKMDYQLDASNIYVLYLPPLNNFQRPSKDSLGGQDLKEHLIVQSYRTLILPWLKEDVLPNITFGSGVLSASLQSYIDLLEGMYGERDIQKDGRTQTLKAFQKHLQLFDAPKDQIWKNAMSWLEKTNFYANKPEQRPETEAGKIDALLASLNSICNLLREDNPLLDCDFVIYQVYWMLRGKPNDFGAKYIQNKLDSGFFFKSGRNQSIWDEVRITSHEGKLHTFTLECSSENLITYLSGSDAGIILKFGIGDLDDNSPALNEFATHNLRIERIGTWTNVLIDNEFLSDAKNAEGGFLLWEVSQAIAGQALFICNQLTGLGWRLENDDTATNSN